MERAFFAKDTITLRTERLTLRPTARTDATAFAEIGSDDVFEFIPQIATPFDAAAWLDTKFAQTVPLFGHTIDAHVTARPIGYIQAEVNPVAHQEWCVEVGYWLGRAFWGQGFATEALRELLRYLNQPGLWPVFADVDLRNTRSIRVLENCGFQFREEGPKPARDGAAWFRWLPDRPAKTALSQR